MLLSLKKWIPWKGTKTCFFIKTFQWHEQLIKEMNSLKRDENASIPILLGLSQPIKEMNSLKRDENLSASWVSAVITFSIKEMNSLKRDENSHYNSTITPYASSIKEMNSLKRDENAFNIFHNFSPLYIKEMNSLKRDENQYYWSHFLVLHLY